MKKFYFLCLLSLMFAQIVNAQTEKQWKAFHSSASEEGTFEYNEKNQLSKSVFKTSSLDDGEEQTESTYSYEPTKIIQQVLLNKTIKCVRTADVKSGLIKRESFVLEGGDNEDPGLDLTLEYEYTSKNQLNIVRLYGVGNKGEVKTFIVLWENGNIVRVKLYSDEGLIGETTFDYYPEPSNKYLSMVFNPIIHILTYSAVFPCGQLLEGAYGKSSVNLLKSVKFESYNDTFEWDATDNFTIIYQKDANGDITKLIQEGEDIVTGEIEWGKVANGIDGVHADEAEENATFYTLSGKAISQPARGLYVSKSKRANRGKVVFKH